MAKRGAERTVVDDLDTLERHGGPDGGHLAARPNRRRGQPPFDVLQQIKYECYRYSTVAPTSADQLLGKILDPQPMQTRNGSFPGLRPAQLPRWNPP